jgi:hypothetical protein
MSCFSTGRLDNDRETADEENAAGGKGISHCDNKAGYDCDQGKGRHGEPGIGEENASRSPTFVSSRMLRRVCTMSLAVTGFVGLPASS